MVKVSGAGNTKSRGFPGHLLGAAVLIRTMGRPRKLDYSQLRRLHANGWTVPLLAERFEASCQAVAYALGQSADMAPESAEFVDKQDPARQDSVRIVLLDDLALYRESLSRILALQPGIHIVARCASISEALDVLASCRAHIVVMGLSSGTAKGNVFLRLLREQLSFGGRVLMIATRMSDLDAVELIRNGVGGIFLTQGSPEQLIQAIWKVAAGEIWLDNPFVDVLMRAAAAGAVSSREGFTERELQVLRGVVEGLGNKQIGYRLHISESAVKSSLQRLFRKLGAESRAQLVRVALERGILVDLE